MGPAGQPTGALLDNTQYLGARFYINRRLEVSQIGGHIAQSVSYGNFFGAIVSLSGTELLPPGNPFLGSEVLASTVFNPGLPSSDYRTPLSVTLRRGYYGLIFGTDALGSSYGDGGMPYEGQTSFPDASYFAWWPGFGWFDIVTNDTRFVIEGNEKFCDASGSNLTEYQYIMGVEVGSINNIPTGNSHYADYTSLSTEMGKEISYPITVTRGNPWEGDECAVWVDWNQDWDFYDAGEQITLTLNPNTFTGTITPPADAVMGDTRMRVRIMWNHTPVPCGDTDYGEVEDYTITVVRGNYCSASGSNLTEYQYIMGVQVGSINNLPTGNDHYADYTALAATMVPEVGYPLTVTRGNPWSGDQCVYDAGERITMTLNPDTFTGTITPPADAAVGDTRMRVRITWNQTPLPCGDTDYGEVEDYTITIPGEYCSGSAVGDLIYVYRVQVERIKNSSSWSENGYADYTGISAEMEIGVGYPTEITILGNGHCGIWVDWNQDYDFDDPCEQIIATGGQEDFSATITPPPDALLGETRLRIRAMSRFDPLSPCGDEYFGEIEDYTITVVNTVGDYCPAAGGGSFDCISEVRIKDIHNTSGCGTYSDYTSLPLSLDINTTYPFEIIGGSYQYSECGVWIDWNQDLDFDDADEQISVGGSLSDTFVGTITPPEGAMLGDTRMRIRVGKLPQSPCGETPRGEVEDYTVTVTDDGGCGAIQYGGGCGTEVSPYLIYTAEHMQAIGANNWHWNKHFKLMADIDLSGYAGEEFNVIGNPATQFTGIFDGNSHTISNFIYNSAQKHCLGIFSKINGPNSIVKNLGLIDPNINGGTGDYVGSLVGELINGMVIDCYSENGMVSGDISVGGLVGNNGGGTIKRCYSTCEVSSSRDMVGGLAGSNWDYYAKLTPLISECYATGSVSGSGMFAGGLVGDNSRGIISKCYASGDVSSSQSVGGLVGWNFSSTISNCYSVGSVSGDSLVGGLVGKYMSGTITGSFWDVNTSGLDYSDGGVGKTTAEMQIQSTFTDTGWDFVGETVNGPNDIWDICEGTNYPKFLWQIPIGDFVCPDGVNFFDFSFFSERWAEDNCGASNDCGGRDLDLLGSVDIKDLRIFADNWLAGF